MTSITHPPTAGDDVTLGPPLASMEVWEQKFRDDLVVDVAFESSLVPKELWIVVVLGALIALREVLL